MGRDVTGRPGLSRDALHVILYEQAGRGGKVTISTKELAEDLGMNANNLSQVLTEMVNAGRLRVVSRGHRAPGVYVVTDPAKWFAEHGFEEDV